MPSYDNPDFAEFMGALAGDGHLTNSNYTYRVELSLNETEDRYYADYLAVKIAELFRVKPRVYTRNEEANRVNVSFHSKKIHNYISAFFPKGKKSSLQVPDWINSTDKSSAYLRGLTDTDGSLFFAKRGVYNKNKYPVIELKLQDPQFLNEIEILLEEFSLKPVRSSNIKIQLNGENRLEKWIRKIGFNNLNRISRYQVWRKKGHCPPNTSLHERLKMLGNKPPG